MVRQVMGGRDEVLPLVFTIFLRPRRQHARHVPYFFTVTSHVIVTAALAVFIILLVITVGLMRHLMVPPVRAHGVPS
jgi:F-type H+-transporting ATPase subunit a